MAAEQRPGPVHWIDHVVLGTNDMSAWVEWVENAFGVTRGGIRGLTTAERKVNRPILSFRFIGDGSCHFGAFLQRDPLPPSKGLGKGTPRYGFFVRPEDIDAHVSRLDAHGIPHTGPVRTAAEGDAGTAIYFEDPDGNQFEFWAPERMPEGAMQVSTDLGVGRISSAVYGSRDLQRTAAFFERFCDLQRLDSSEVPEDTLVLPLVGGGRLVYNLVDETDERTGGHGPWTGMHAALTVRNDEYFANYRRMWDGIPEASDTERDGLSIAQEDALPARTRRHGSPAGRKWKEAYERGDEFYDWDAHLFHFVGGVVDSAGDSLAVYRPKDLEDQVKELEKAVAASTRP